MLVFKRLISLVVFVGMIALLCGCPPLKHRIFVRNTTADTAYLTLIYKSDSFIAQKNIQVRAINKVIPMNGKSISLLNEQLTASAAGNKINVAIPPKSTVFVSDIINSFYLFADKTLVIQHGNETDSMQMDYPFKKLQNSKRRRDGFDLFYRMIIYMDIK